MKFLETDFENRKFNKYQSKLQRLKIQCLIINSR